MIAVEGASAFAVVVSEVDGREVVVTEVVVRGPSVVDGRYLGIDMPKIGFSENGCMTKNFYFEVVELVSVI